MEKDWWMITIKTRWGSFWDAVYTDIKGIREVEREQKANGNRVIIEKLGKNGEKEKWPT